MNQVGHADSKMTMDVYAQLEQRVERSHGTNFDRLGREVREQSIGFRLGSGPENVTFDPSEGAAGDTPDPAPQSGSDGMARAGLEPPTPRFSASRRGGCEGMETALGSGMPGRRERHCTRRCGRIYGGFGTPGEVGVQCRGFAGREWRGRPVKPVARRCGSRRRAPPASNRRSSR